MSTVKIAALGGLGENGKNMYIVSENDHIYILDSGIKYPTVELYGIDTIIPDYKYLVNNKEKIVGIFLSHAHSDVIGAIPHLIKELNVPVYGTNFTLALVKDMLQEAGLNPEEYNLNVVSDSKPLIFNHHKVSFFNTTHSIPETIGIVIETSDGNIVYTSNFTFDQNVDGNYKTSYNRLNDIEKRGVKCLLVESSGSDNQFASNHYELMHKLNDIFSNANGRIVFSLFSDDLLRIQQIVDLAIGYEKKIAIIGRKTQRIVDIAINLGYLKINPDNLVNLRYIDDKNSNNDSNLVVLITGARHEPFFMMQRMCKKIDRLIHIDKEDTVVVMTNPISGTEKMAARTLDVLYRTGAKIITMDKKNLVSSHATSEEIKMMINILKPEYIFPVLGEFRHQYHVRDIARGLGYDDEHIIMADNGDLLTFKNGVLESKVGDINASEILIDGAVAGDVNDVVLRDRELLGEDGVLLIIANVNPKTKKVLSGPEIISKGFVYVKDSIDILDGVKQIFVDISNKYMTAKYINWAEYKNDIKQEVNKFLYRETKRTPITIPVILSTDTTEVKDNEEPKTEVKKNEEKKPLVKKVEKPKKNKESL